MGIFISAKSLFLIGFRGKIGVRRLEVVVTYGGKVCVLCVLRRMVFSDGLV